MNRELQELHAIVKSLDDTGIGRCLAILATLAERGLAASLESQPDKAIDDDPLWSPARTANYMDVTVATLRVYRRRYEMDSLGSGKDRRYRKSEVERIIKLRAGDHDGERSDP